MRHIFFIPLMCLALMPSTCKSKQDRHYYITIINQSDKDIHICYKFRDTAGQCALIPRAFVEKNSVFEFQPFRYNLERELGGIHILELYFVNNRQPHDFGDCDLIPVINDILVHYKLTLDDLQRMNWTVIYPPEE